MDHQDVQCDRMPTQLGIISVKLCLFDFYDKILNMLCTYFMLVYVCYLHVMG